MMWKDEMPPPAHGSPDRQSHFFCAIRISAGSVAGSFPHAQVRTHFAAGVDRPPLPSPPWYGESDAPRSPPAGLAWEDA